MDKDLEELGEGVPVRPGRISWASLVGAAFGFALGLVWVTLGWWQAVACAILAVIGGFLGRYYVGEVPSEE